jgi:hypothetical protein
MWTSNAGHGPVFLEAAGQFAEASLKSLGNNSVA